MFRKMITIVAIIAVPALASAQKYGRALQVGGKSVVQSVTKE